MGTMVGHGLRCAMDPGATLGSYKLTKKKFRNYQYISTRRNVCKLFENGSAISRHFVAKFAKVFTNNC